MSQDRPATKRHSFALAPVLLAALAAPALAQEAPAPAETANPANREGVISYTPADFAAARPNTALDMINRLPGFSLERGDDVRGFAGAAGNVLIDGKRPTTKSESLNNVLSRIQIDQVERIELIRGGAAGIDMQGQSVVANVIRTGEDAFQQTLTLRSHTFLGNGKTLPGGNYQATRNVGDHQLDFEFSRGISLDDSQGEAYRTLLDVDTGAVTFQDSFNEADGNSHSLRGNYEGPLVGGDFSANALISTDTFKDEADFYNAASYERYVGTSDNDRGEIGLNYTRPLSERFELETLGLWKLAIGEGTSSGNDGQSVSFVDIEAEAGESIARSVLRYEHSPDLSFEGGGEIAFNYREQSIALTQDGAFIPLPASDVRIEELRGETFAQGTWRPSDKWSFEAGVRVEQSTITQSGDTELERSFTYPKPRFLATWSPDEDNQVRVRIEREVGQLNFRDFISNVNLSSDVLTAGNANLEPDKTWIYEVAFEKRFWEDGAAILTLRHEEIADAIDDFPFAVFSDADGDGVPDDADNDGQPDTQRVSGPGNIGDGTNDVIELDLTVPMDRLGLVGGEFKANLTYQDSEVIDPLTGEPRRISRQRPDDLTLEYRHDLPGRDLTLGVLWFDGWKERRYRLTEVQKLDLSNFIVAFAEYKPTDNFSLRTELTNLGPYDFGIQRLVYDAPRDVGMLDQIETETRKSQVQLQIRARWTFG